MSAWGVANTAPAPAEDKEALPTAFQVRSKQQASGGFSDQDFPTMGAVLKKKDDVENDYSLGGTAGGKKGKKNKKASQKLSLADFNQQLGGSVGIAALPTAPRERDPDEEINMGPSLGGAFKDYGGDRGGGRNDFGREQRAGFDRDDRREERGPRRGEDDEFAGPSRADEDGDWGKSKKFVPSGPPPRRGGGDDMRDPRDRDPRDRRDDGDERMGGRADEDGDWGKSKKFVPSEPREPPRRNATDGVDDWRPRGGAPRGDDERHDAPAQPDRSDWRKREDPVPPVRDFPPVGERPRLQLQKRTVPVDAPPAAATSDDAESKKANPFGGARPVAVKEVEEKKVELGPEESREEAPKRPSDDHWGKARKEAPTPHAPATAAAASSQEEPKGPAARPRLKLAPRTTKEAPAAATKNMASLFGGARPRELALEEKGRDWRKEEIELSRKGISRPDSEEETKLKAEVDSLRQKVADGEADDSLLKMKEAELHKLCLDLDDKVRFASGAKGEKGEGKPEREHRAREPREKQEREPRSRGPRDGHKRDERPAPRDAPKPTPLAAPKQKEAPKVSVDGWEEAKPRGRGKQVPVTTEPAPAVTVGSAFDGLQDK